MQRLLQHRQQSQQKNKMKAFAIYLILGLVLSQANCGKKKSHANIDINDCDSIGNYYENGEHYIRRDLFNDDGVIDYNKMLESYKGRNTVCNPLNLEPESKKSN